MKIFCIFPFHCITWWYVDIISLIYILWTYILLSSPFGEVLFTTIFNIYIIICLDWANNRYTERGSRSLQPCTSLVQLSSQWSHHVGIIVSGLVETGSYSRSWLMQSVFLYTVCINQDEASRKVVVRPRIRCCLPERWGRIECGGRAIFCITARANLTFLSASRQRFVRRHNNSNLPYMGKAGLVSGAMLVCFRTTVAGWGGVD